MPEFTLEEARRTKMRSAVKGAMAACRGLDDTLLDVRLAMRGAPTYQQNMLLDCTVAMYKTLGQIENLGAEFDA